MKAWEVSDGFDAVFCATPEDARLVADELLRRLNIIGSTDTITIEEMEIRQIPEQEQRWVQQLRESALRRQGGQS